MDRIFLDTSFLLAFADKNDKHHDESRQIMKEIIDEEVYISDRVFTETVNTIFSRSSHDKAKNFAEYLTKSEIRVITTTQSVFQESYDIFQSESISFTDCSIVSTMKTLNIEKLGSFDTDFQNFEKIELIER